MIKYIFLDGMLSLEDQNDLVESGYNGPGWYYYDETESNMHGPYANRYDAEDEEIAYVGSLPWCWEELSWKIINVSQRRS